MNSRDTIWLFIATIVLFAVLAANGAVGLTIGVFVLVVAFGWTLVKLSRASSRPQ